MEALNGCPQVTLPIGLPRRAQLATTGQDPVISRRAVFPMVFPLAASISRLSIAAGLQRFSTSELTIVSATGRHRFKVEVAETPAQMEQGLMFRRSLAPDAGMLFDYKQPTVATRAATCSRS